MTVCQDTTEWFWWFIGGETAGQEHTRICLWSGFRLFWSCWTTSTRWRSPRSHLIILYVQVSQICVVLLSMFLCSPCWQSVSNTHFGRPNAQTSSQFLLLHSKLQLRSSTGYRQKHAFMASVQEVLNHFWILYQRIAWGRTLVANDSQSSLLFWHGWQTSMFDDTLMSVFLIQTWNNIANSQTFIYVI